MRFEYASRFERSLRRLTPQNRIKTAETIEQIIQYCETQHAPEGLGLRKLFTHSGLGGVFEARVSLALRLLFTIYENVVTFVMVGNHDDVRQFIRNVR